MGEAVHVIHGLARPRDKQVAAKPIAGAKPKFQFRKARQRLFHEGHETNGGLAAGGGLLERLLFFLGIVVPESIIAGAVGPIEIRFGVEGPVLVGGGHIGRLRRPFGPPLLGPQPRGVVDQNGDALLHVVGRLQGIPGQG